MSAVDCAPSFSLVLSPANFTLSRRSGEPLRRTVGEWCESLFGEYESRNGSLLSEAAELVSQYEPQFRADIDSGDMAFDEAIVLASWSQERMHEVFCKALEQYLQSLGAF